MSSSSGTFSASSSSSCAAAPWLASSCARLASPETLGLWLSPSSSELMWTQNLPVEINCAPHSRHTQKYVGIAVAHDGHIRHLSPSHVSSFRMTTLLISSLISLVCASNSSSLFSRNSSHARSTMHVFDVVQIVGTCLGLRHPLVDLRDVL